MKKINKAVAALIIIMTVLSFTNLFNIKVNGETLKLAGLSVIVGIIAFFATRRTNGSKDEGLDIKSFVSSIKEIKVILLVLAPMGMNILCFVIASFFLPEYIEHLNSRTDFLSAAQLPALFLELLVAALGEEIAWRAFFQKQISKVIPWIPSLLIASVLFSLGHFSSGSAVVVSYDLFFIFANALFYGLVFKKTDNAWCSALAHFLANLLGMFLTIGFLGNVG